MSRQRTINDSAFWRSAKMAGRTQEDRATLTYLLTCPFSNIIGAYQIVPRIAASEMGWDTESQFLPILHRLQDSGFIQYDSNHSYIWVHIWWDHNYPRMALGPTLRQKTFNQIRELPEHWRELYIEDLIQRFPENSELRELITSTFDPLTRPEADPIDRVSIPYASTIDRGRVNYNYNYNYNPTTALSSLPKGLSTGDYQRIGVMLKDVTEQDASFLLAELAKAMSRPGHITQSPLQYFHGLIQSHQRGDFVPTATPPKAAAAIARSQLKALVANAKN
ncbi:hypothetical protein [Pseudomonas sp. OTU750018]|uniref:hypothetical protein n=1 Tax=Pseudomonas sp. OTU750018 TaxID=2709708 RepID=UPI001422C51B|nr:hypothetical protein [Pseudomonas sp. OTU750018]